MAARFVCTAERSHRTDCGSGCSGCAYLINDRRKQSVQKLSWSDSDRRIMSNWLPPNFELATAGAHAPRSGVSGRDNAGATLMYLGALLIVFNLLDSILTARALSMGYTEANPVMAGLFNMSLPMGMLFKSAIVGLGAMALWKFRHLPVAMRGMTAATVLYGSVILYHLYFQIVVA
ncbi:MAG: DUF5658 family protein [Actinobacteria bacterium]|nr:DUF5658 family protein [Actinomycetota bacterium]MCL5882642.1 DUF5658 family protein [Actinomycetota bacterium]